MVALQAYAADGFGTESRKSGECQNQAHGHFDICTAGEEEDFRGSWSGDVPVLL